MAPRGSDGGGGDAAPLTLVVFRPEAGLAPMALPGTPAQVAQELHSKASRSVDGFLEVEPIDAHGPALLTVASWRDVAVLYTAQRARANRVLPIHNVPPSLSHERT